MPSPQISAQEQLMLELINRARLDPLGEAARYGIDLNANLAAGTITSAPKAPLAFSATLSVAAAAHSEWMLAADVFSHTGAGGSSSKDRMANAGYSFTGGWRSGENISWRGTTGTLDITGSVMDQHKSLFLSAGHRVNILGDFREVGIAQEIGGFTKSGTTYNASMITQDYAKSGTDAFLTGVAFADRDGDRFYDVGEGQAGVVVDVLGDAVAATGTAAAGGYAAKIALGLTGTATVAVTAGATTMQATLAMTGTSVKLDVVDGKVLAASTSLTLGAGGIDARLLGVASQNLTGNAGANVLDGNAGANTLRGEGGNDTLRGGDGADVLIGGAGSDALVGGNGADDFVFLAVSDSAYGVTRDVIQGFNVGLDDIDVSAVDANEGLAGNQAFTVDTNGIFVTGEMRQRVTTEGLVVEFNTDADASPDLAILVAGMTTKLAVTDFIL